MTRTATPRTAPGTRRTWSGTPRRRPTFLDGALGNLYLLTALEELDPQRGDDAPDAGLDGVGSKPVPLPVLAASMMVPEDMEVPTDDVLEEVSDAMMRLDDHFRLLEPIGLVEYQPVDDALIEERPPPGTSWRRTSPRSWATRRSPATAWSG